MALAIALGGCTGLPTASPPDDGTGAGPTANTPAPLSSTRSIAVLLPRTGHFAPAASAIRAGILAAQQASASQTQIGLRFYDSSDPAAAPDLIRRAMANGANVVVGPLQPLSVDRAAAARLPVTTLALNRMRGDRTAPDWFYQFALSPNDEVAEIARHASERGATSALLIYPDDAWGIRLAGAFRDAWSAQGGRIDAGYPYPAIDVEVADLIDALVRTAPGDADPAGGADCIVLIGTAGQVARIWPSLRPLAGPDRRVYSTSHILDDTSAPGADLQGLYVVDVPGILAPDPGAELAPGSAPPGKEQQRLFAMGVDAYRIAARLPLTADPSSPSRQRLTLQGQSGDLHIDHWNRVHRTLPLAQMTAAGPRRVD